MVIQSPNFSKTVKAIHDLKRSGVLFTCTPHRCNSEKNRYYAQIFEKGEPITKRYRISKYDPEIPSVVWQGKSTYCFVPVQTPKKEG